MTVKRSSYSTRGSQLAFGDGDGDGDLFAEDILLTSDYLRLYLKKVPPIDSPRDENGEENREQIVEQNNATRTLQSFIYLWKWHFADVFLILKKY